MASKTILVIDADSETEQLIASTLETEGYLVFAVPGGDVGAEMAQKVSPSIIFINADETGLQMCKTIRSYESLTKVPLVLLSSPIGAIDPAEVAAYGVADVLKVPFTAAELLEKTARILDAKAPIVLHVKEKEPARESEEAVSPDFFEIPEQTSGTEARARQARGITAFDEGPDEGSTYGKGEDSEPKDSYTPKETYRRRRKKSSVPAIIAAAVILIIGIAAGGLFYLGMIPGLETRKAASVKPSAVAAKPKARAPMPVAPPAATAAPTSEKGLQKQALPAKPPTPVKEEPSAPSAVAAPSTKVKPSGKTVYSVQLGAFKSEGNATALMKKFKGKGYDVFMVKSAGKGGGALYRVLVGKSADRKESAKMAARIRDEEKIKAVIYNE
jgi:CheY-like chemotaxis protein